MAILFPAGISGDKRLVDPDRAIVSGSRVIQAKSGENQAVDKVYESFQSRVADGCPQLIMTRLVMVAVPPPVTRPDGKPVRADPGS
jgi:hypothetical protein